MSIKRSLALTGMFLGILVLSACAGGGGGPSVKDTAPPPAGTADVAPEVTMSSADRLAEKLVGSQWEGNVTIANCENSPVKINFVFWAYNKDLMRVLASSEDCPVLQGGFLGSILNGKLAVRSFDNKRRIFLTPNMEFGVAPGRIELGNAKTDVTFRQIQN